MGFEPAMPAIKRPQTYALDPTVTGIGYEYIKYVNLLGDNTNTVKKCKAFCR
jgi:hypothetical protein